ncbi:MAG: pyridoxal phosphate-dependent class II aminotransferase [Euryarchaeota archaeon]|nr:pyridoxal phosphate-dependent class II aminotransferase [Euryarchaeota archaeon]
MLSLRPPHGGGPPGVVDFSVNLNPLPFPPASSLRGAAVGRYPDDSYREFRRGAARFCGSRTGCIIPGSGSTEILHLFARTHLGPGERVVVERPAYGEYAREARLAGARVADFPRGRLHAVPMRGVRALFVGNPNNPTGDLRPRGELLELWDRCRRAGTLLVVDEAFIELSDPGESLAPRAARGRGLLVVRSLTKSFAIPGLRVGYGVASPDLYPWLEGARCPWNLSGPGEAAALRCFQGGRSHLARSRRYIEGARGEMARGLSTIPGVWVHPGRANFLLLDTPRSARRVAHDLLRRGLRVRDCTSFGLPRSIRVAVLRRVQNRRLIEALRQAVRA